LIVLATVAGALAYLAFAVFGVIYVLKGETALGLVLLACLAFGLPNFFRWRKRLHQPDQ
jgi:hypothetical protein